MLTRTTVLILALAFGFVLASAVTIHEKSIVLRGEAMLMEAAVVGLLWGVICTPMKKVRWLDRLGNIILTGISSAFGVLIAIGFTLVFPVWVALVAAIGVCIAGMIWVLWKVATIG